MLSIIVRPFTKAHWFLLIIEGKNDFNLLAKIFYNNFVEGIATENGLVIWDLWWLHTIGHKSNKCCIKSLKKMTCVKKLLYSLHCNLPCDQQCRHKKFWSKSLWPMTFIRSSVPFKASRISEVDTSVDTRLCRSVASLWGRVSCNTLLMSAVERIAVPSNSEKNPIIFFLIPISSITLLPSTLINSFICHLEDLHWITMWYN